MALVNEGPAVAGEDALLHEVAEIDFLGAFASVQGPGGAHQVAGIGLARVPPLRFAVQAELHLQVVLAEGFAIGLVPQGSGP